MLVVLGMADQIANIVQQGSSLEHVAPHRKQLRHGRATDEGAIDLHGASRRLRFDHHRAAEKSTELDTDDGDGRQGRVAGRGQSRHRAPGHPWRAQCE
jgi:hypothetical protein